MYEFRREPTSAQDEYLPISLDRYDPCEIDPPAYMFARLGVMVAVVLGLVFVAGHLANPTH
jgi:hypothetical protein